MNNYDIDLVNLNTIPKSLVNYKRNILKAMSKYLFSLI